MNNQAQIDFGRKNRDAGMKRAIDHANAVTPDWEEMAYSFFVNVFLKHVKGEFQCEDLRAQCKGIVPDPPNLRAYGSLMRKAKHEGLIINTGRTRPVKNPKAQMANAAVWVSVANI
jgi:hypothetical protein